MIHVIWWMFCYTGVTPLGIIPPASAIAGLKLPIIGENSGTRDAPHSGDDKEASTVAATSGNNDLPAPFMLGEGLPPVPGRLVQKIQRGDYVDMAELLRDNMELERRKASCESSASALGLGIQPSCREVPNLISWVQCFGVYAAIVSAKHADRMSTPGLPDHGSS